MLMGLCLNFENLVLEASPSRTSSGMSEHNTRNLRSNLKLRYARRTWGATARHFTLRQVDTFFSQLKVCAVIYMLSLSVDYLLPDDESINSELPKHSF